MTDKHIDAKPLIEKLADDLFKHLQDKRISDFRIVGIRTGGVWVAQALKKKLGHNLDVGELNINFYRDDFTRIGLHPTVTATRLPFSTEGTHIILVDDILMSGRTIRAALNELFDFGRPASVALAVLADIGRRELPISATVAGKTLSLEPHQRLKLEGPEEMRLALIDKATR